MRKMGFYLQGQSHSNWISVHAIKYDYFYYMLWNCCFGGATDLVWKRMWSVLWKGCFAVFKVKVTVMGGSHDRRSLQLSKSCISLQLFEITNGRQKDELNQA